MTVAWAAGFTAVGTLYGISSIMMGNLLFYEKILYQLFWLSASVLGTCARRLSGVHWLKRNRTDSELYCFWGRVYSIRVVQIPGIATPGIISKEDLLMVSLKQQVSREDLKTGGQRIFHVEKIINYIYLWLTKLTEGSVKL